jgi:glutathione S-transferase
VRLLTIPISHYCERARWALEHAGVPYREEQHLQFFHWSHVRRAGGGKTVPVLVTGDGEVLAESGDIVRYASARAPAGRSLYPVRPEQAAEVAALEADYEHELGIESRRLMYFHFLRWGAAGLRFNAGTAPALERAGLRLSFVFARPILRRYLEVDAGTAARARDRIRAIFDRVAVRLEEGRRYLVGESFSAADLTFASMAAAVVLPEQYGVRLPGRDELPSEIVEVVDAHRAHPAGDFALRMFRDHREAARI